MLSIFNFSRVSGVLVFLTLIIISPLTASQFDNLSPGFTKHNLTTKVSNLEKATGWKNQVFYKQSDGQTQNNDKPPLFGYVNNPNTIDSLIEPVIQDKDFNSSSPFSNQTSFVNRATNSSVCAPTQIDFGAFDDSLSNTDCFNGFYYDEYKFTGTANQNITITMNSTAFTTYLELYSPNNQNLAIDSGGGGGRNSRITLTLTAPGTYSIVASSAAPNVTGAYTLSLINNNQQICALQPADMLFWYKGEGNITDSSGNSYNGTFFNGSYSAGKVGQAMSFNGASYVEVGLPVTPGFPNELYRRNEQITVAAWIRQTITAIDQTIISRFNNDNSNFHFSVDNGKLYFEVNENDTISRSYITSNPIISAGVYYHVAATFNTTTQLVEIFVNGIKIPVTLVNAGTITSIKGRFNRARLGVLTNNADQSTQYFAGQIDEAQIYERVLSSSEIQSIYNAGGSGVCTGYKVSGRVMTANGRLLGGVPIAAANGFKTVKTKQKTSIGQYNINLEQSYNHIIAPKLSTHSFSPPNYPFNSLTADQTGKDFTATLINDNFVNAVQLTGESGEIDGNNQDATRETGEPFHAGVLGGTSVWYRWRAPRNGAFTFTLGGSDFDTLLAVYRGTNVGNLTQVTANDNLSVATFSQVTLTAQANTDYYIAVDGRAGGVNSGLFKLIYHPADYLPGFTVSGSVKLLGGREVQGAAIKAENSDGRIIATSITDNNEAYSIVIPQGISSFKLTAFADVIEKTREDTVYGFANFLNITQNQTYNFSTVKNTAQFFISGQIIGLSSNAGLSVTVSGPNIVGSQPCGSHTFGYACQGLSPNGTYTVTPSHPTFTFLPSSRTFVSVSQNILNAAFITVNSAAPGFTISGKVLQGNTPLNGVKLSIEAKGGEKAGGAFTGFYLLETETDANGNYSFAHLPAGFYYNEFKIYLPGFNFTPASPPSFPNLQIDQTVNFSATSKCSYTLLNLQQDVPASGGLYSFNITANPGCPWEAKSNSTGITVITPLSYANGTVSYNVEANTGPARTSTIAVAGQTFTINQAGRVLYDFDGDRKADISVFRPDGGVWYLLQSHTGFAATQFGIFTDKIVTADYDGDGRTDIAVFRNGDWYWLNSSNGTFNAVHFGQAGDVPIAGDFDGDGKNDLTVFRNGVWYILQTFNGQFWAAQFGLSTDKPLTGDYDGDGKADLAVYRDGNWYILGSTQGFFAISFGISTDKPVPADYDGDGKTDVAVYRSGIWYLLGSRDGFIGVQFGIAADLPSPADYDGDGKTDVAVFRNGVWYLLGTTSGFSGVQFGVGTDKPVSNAFVP